MPPTPLDSRMITNKISRQQKACKFSENLENLNIHVDFSKYSLIRNKFRTQEIYRIGSIDNYSKYYL